MAKSDHSNVALVGGAGLLAYWLLSRGKGLGGPDHGGADANANPKRPATRSKVWIRAKQLEIDGVAADLVTLVAKARGAGEAEVHATGDAITRVVQDVLVALHKAGVKLFVPPDLARVVPTEPV